MCGGILFSRCPWVCACVPATDMDLGAFPILGQVATLRSFQLESILECPALDVRQLVRNKRHKEYDSHTT